MKYTTFIFCSSWSGSLQLARVTHWGGMISTPDVLLQDAVRHALLESGCPVDITNELMENAHERRWPEGLSTLGKRSLSLIILLKNELYIFRNSTIK